jgi:hypothetical protein
MWGVPIKENFLKEERGQKKMIFFPLTLQIPGAHKINIKDFKFLPKKSNR